MIRAAVLRPISGVTALLILSSPAHAQTADSAAFVTLLGTDTLAVERFVVAPDGMTAETVLRSPTTVFSRYRIELNGRGELVRYEGASWPAARRSGKPARRESIVRDGPEYTYELHAGETHRERTLTSAVPVLPFIDMIHWPFELVLRQAHAQEAEEVAQPLVSGGRVLPFTILRRGVDEFGVRHPSRGTMDVRTDDRGRLLWLDAAATTRKVEVRRTGWLDVEAYADEFASRDAGGHPFGALSGRGEAHATVHGADIVVDYGTPSKRGREIFGALVPYGDVWRTGANRATHLTTSRDLRLGDLDVPAGSYTLFSIPEPDGGVLIVNRRTGITGTAYDASMDLGRTPMTRSAGANVVEVFTIRVNETPEGGVLQLVWDRDVFSVPFTVR